MASSGATRMNRAVKSVTGHRKVKTGRQYLVKRAGDRKPMWESADGPDDLSVEYTSPSIIIEYFKTTTTPMKAIAITSIHRKYDDEPEEGFDVGFENDFACVVTNMTRCEVVAETNLAVRLFSDAFKKVEALRKQSIQLATGKVELGTKRIRISKHAIKAPERSMKTVTDQPHTLCQDVIDRQEPSTSKAMVAEMLRKRRRVDFAVNNSGIDEGKALEQDGDQMDDSSVIIKSQDEVLLAESETTENERDSTEPDDVQDTGQESLVQPHDEVIIIDTQYAPQSTALKRSTARNLPPLPDLSVETIQID